MLHAQIVSSSRLCLIQHQRYTYESLYQHLSSCFSPVHLSHLIHVLLMWLFSFLSLLVFLFSLHHLIHVGECSWKPLLICRDFWYDHDYITLSQWWKNICLNSARQAAACLIMSWFFRHCGELKSAVLYVLCGIVLTYTLDLLLLC